MDGLAGLDGWLDIRHTTTTSTVQHCISDAVKLKMIRPSKDRTLKGQGQVKAMTDCVKAFNIQQNQNIRISQ